MAAQTSVRRSGLRNRKKDRNRTEPDRLGPDRRLRLRKFRIERPRLRDRSQPVLSATGRLQGTPSKYLPNEPKIVENDQDLTELLNFY